MQDLVPLERKQTELMESTCEAMEELDLFSLHLPGKMIAAKDCTLINGDEDEAPLVTWLGGIIQERKNKPCMSTY